MADIVSIALVLSFAIGVEADNGNSISTDSTSCVEARECEGQTLDSALCYGYRSCADIVIPYTSSWTLCDGIYSCYRADINSADTISCGGRYSCQSAILKTSDALVCDGFSSCKFAEIDSWSIYGNGEFSLSRARIDSFEETYISVKLNGAHAGREADVICRSGSTCKIICSGNGCDGLNLSCLSGSICTITPSSCTIDTAGAVIDGITCPSWTITTSSEEDAILLTEIEARRESNINIANSEKDENIQSKNEHKLSKNSLVSIVDTNNCDGTGECQGQTLNGITYCSGIASCQNAVIQTGYYTQCSGLYSCFKAEIISSDTIDCDGIRSCESATLQTSDALVCDGEKSCQYADIEAFNIYGNGELSLYDAVIDSNDNNYIYVRVNGINAGKDATVICRSGKVCKIYCSGNGCDGLNLNCLSGSTCSVTPSSCTVNTDGAVIDGITCPLWTISTSLAQDEILYDEQVVLNKNGLVKVNTNYFSGLISSSLWSICIVITIIASLKCWWYIHKQYPSKTGNDEYQSLL